jgi:hypothetical protein
LAAYIEFLNSEALLELAACIELEPPFELAAYIEFLNSEAGELAAYIKFLNPKALYWLHISSSST